MEFIKRYFSILRIRVLHLWSNMLPIMDVGRRTDHWLVYYLTPMPRNDKAV